MVRRDRESRAVAGSFLRVLLVPALIVIVAGAFAAFYSGAAPKVTVKPERPGIGRRTPIRIRIEDPQRVERVRVEVVQNMDVKPVMEKTFEPRPVWKIWGGPPPAELTAEVGTETVKGLRTGEATVRVTAERAGSLFRHPAPVVREVKLPVRLAPPTLQIVSNFHYVNAPMGPLNGVSLLLQFAGLGTAILVLRKRKIAQEFKEKAQILILVQTVALLFFLFSL